ncbi:MAG: TonB-dependent receptor [Prevotellaceae bacterium]|jgi:TonB-linked SusC/RagA family outer membrane protein|nr:TonB-dependent receptor [Prevotellaceae bacterium]
MTKVLKIIGLLKNPYYKIKISSCRVGMILLITLVPSAYGFAQQGTKIEGRVIDERSQAQIVEASVSLSGQGKGVSTDNDGKFTIVAQSFPTTVSVSYLGYRTVELEIYEYTEPIVISLREDLNYLNEVVVVGYGTQKRKELTGAISTVSKSALQQVATSFDNLLGGAVAGLHITESGGPGSTFSARLRGTNSLSAGNEPLFVIDGVITYHENSATDAGVGRVSASLNPLAAISPSDIESIEVLKDVSATAIYGSRGANGVIIITTKSGKQGANHVEYQYSLGVQQVTKQLDLMRADDWARLNREINANSAFKDYSDSEIAALGAGYDWQDATFRSALTQTHQFTFSGGDDKSHYLISGNYTDQDGVIINSDFKRYTGRFNFDRKIFKKITVGLNVNASKLNQTGLSSYSGLYVGGYGSSLDHSIRVPRVVPIYNADGSYNHNNPWEVGELSFNDISVNAIEDLEKQYAQNLTNSIIGNFYVSYNILPELTLKINAGTTLTNATQNYFAPPTTAGGFLTNGYGSVGNRRTDAYQYEYTLNYSKQFNSDHSLDVLAGYTTQINRVETSTLATSEFANEGLSYHSLQSGAVKVSTNTGGSEALLKSFIGRLNYSFKGRYNLTATLRADGSSRFAINNKWGYFPSVGVSWNINREAFLINNKNVSDLKLRASFGTVGNQEIGNYQYAATYGVTSNPRYSFNDNVVVSYGRANAENPNLKWEQTASYNVGVDVGVLKNRLNFVADVYYKKTSNLLNSVPTEITTGFSSILTNIGSISNKGVEFEVRATPVETRDFTWNISGNIARNVNEVLDLGERTEIVGGNTITKVGQPLGVYSLILFDGIIQQGDSISKIPAPSWKKDVAVGDAKYVDQPDAEGKKDGAINTSSDRVLLDKTSSPEFFYGFSTNLRYKAFNLFVSFQGVEGRWLYNSLRESLETPSASNNVSATLVNRWTSTNPSTTIPRAYISSQTVANTTRYLEDGSYLRVKNITLSYDLPIKIAQAPSAKFKVFATGQNLLTFTKFTGYDPETGGGASYPASKTFTFGINIIY